MEGDKNNFPLNMWWSEMKLLFYTTDLFYTATPSQKQIKTPVFPYRLLSHTCKERPRFSSKSKFAFQEISLSGIVRAVDWMAKLYVETTPPLDLNKNTEWFMYPGVWTTYILIVFFSWLIVLCLFGCTPGVAWTIVNLSHFAITYHFFHWKKGTPFADADQGIYNNLTWWEQMDSGKQLTRNRKFLTVVPVVLYLIASHTTDYQNPMLALNTIAVCILVVAKQPNMHKVRILGINGEN